MKLVLPTRTSYEAGPTGTYELWGWSYQNTQAMGPVLPTHKLWGWSYRETQALGLVPPGRMSYGAGPTETHKLWGWSY